MTGAGIVCPIFLLNLIVCSLSLDLLFDISKSFALLKSKFENKCFDSSSSSETRSSLKIKAEKKSASLSIIEAASAMNDGLPSLFKEFVLLLDETVETVEEL